MRSGQRFSYLALDPEETRTLNAAYYERIHRDQSNLIPLDLEAFIQTALELLELLASDRYLQKGMGLMALTGRRPAEIFFSASFSLPQLKSFPSPEAVNTTTGPQLPKYVSAAFGSLDLPWKPGHLRSAYGAICCHKFKPKNITDDIFLAQILGHKLLGPNASLSVGQSYKDFYIRDIP
jgi:hypothetical protein